MSYTYYTTLESTGPDDTVVGSVEVRITYDWVAGSPEYIPPYNRPDLYDPGGGPEITWTAVDYEPHGDKVWVPAPKCIWEWAEGQVDDETLDIAAEDEEHGRYEAAMELRADELRERRFLQNQ